MALSKKQAANKKNQRQLKKTKKIVQVQLEEDIEEGNDHELKSDKAEHKEHSLVLEDENNSDSDEGFVVKKASKLHKKVSKIQKMANQIKEEKGEKKKLGKTNKAKKADLQSNGNAVLTKEDCESNAETKDTQGYKKKESRTIRSSRKEARSLFIGKLPVDIIEQDVSDLSKDIVEIYSSRSKDPNFRFAIVRFKDEETAERNYSILKTKKINGEPLTIDYMGRKSSHHKDLKERNARKLFVGNLPDDITEKELKQLSEDIAEIYISQGKKRFAFLIFASQDKAMANYEIIKDQQIRGQPITLDYNHSKDASAKKSTAEKGKRSHDNLKEDQQSAKKMKL